MKAPKACPALSEALPSDVEEDEPPDELLDDAAPICAKAFWIAVRKLPAPPCALVLPTPFCWPLLCSGELLQYELFQ